MITIVDNPLLLVLYSSTNRGFEPSFRLRFALLPRLADHLLRRDRLELRLLLGGPTNQRPRPRGDETQRKRGRKWEKTLGL